jgi:hypothetical protein
VSSAAVWLVFGIVAAWGSWIAWRIGGAHGHRNELDKYKLAREDDGRIFATVEMESGRKMSFYLDARVAFRFADDLTRAAIRAAKKDGSDAQ